MLTTALIIITDHLRLVPYKAVFDEIDGLARQQSVPSHEDRKYQEDAKYQEIHMDHKAGVQARHQD